MYHLVDCLIDSGLDEIRTACLIFLEGGCGIPRRDCVLLAHAALVSFICVGKCGTCVILMGGWGVGGEGRVVCTRDQERMKKENEIKRLDL